MWRYDKGEPGGYLAQRPSDVEISDADALDALLNLAAMEAFGETDGPITCDALIAKVREIEPTIEQSDEQLRSAIDASWWLSRNADGALVWTQDP